jgi:hypothetical protein
MVDESREEFHSFERDVRSEVASETSDNIASSWVRRLGAVALTS